MAGCGSRGPKLYKCTGTVTLQGQPLANATVVFVSADGKAVTTITDVQGKYALAAPSGRNAVAVSKTARQAAAGAPASMPGTTPGATADSNLPPGAVGLDPESIQKSMEAMKAAYEQSRGQAPEEVTRLEVPSRYARFQTSGLAAEVTDDPSKNVFDFKLE